LLYSRSQGNLWKEAAVSTNFAFPSYHLLLEAVSGRNGFAHVALDDVSHDADNECVRDVVVCDFQTGTTCGWTNVDSSEHFMWKVAANGSDTPSTGPRSVRWFVQGGCMLAPQH
jgi:hypothetical protein